MLSPIIEENFIVSLYEQKMVKKQLLFLYPNSDSCKIWVAKIAYINESI